MTAQLTQLGRQQEALSEKFNLMRADVTAKQRQAATASQAAAKSAADFARSRAQFTTIVAAQYESSTFSSAGALLTSQNGQNYLDKMTQLDLMASHRGDIVVQLNAAKAKSDAARQTADTSLTDTKTALDAVTVQRAAIESQKKKFETLLATLTAQQQRAYANRNAVPVATARAVVKAAAAASPAAPAATLTAHAGSAAAQKAVDFALAQVGKPYVFAASGPDAYDCSGLTAAAWATAGVQLPHNAAAQYGFGTHVSLDALQPGDLVFMYSPIGHVEIYIGNGLAVSAPQEGENVKVINVASADNVGATRLT